VDEIHWNISWGRLAPDLSMIPDSDIFLHTSQERSLTATIEGVPGLLFSSPDTIWDIFDIAEESFKSLAPMLAVTSL